MISLRFEAGTLTLDAAKDDLPPPAAELCCFDERSSLWRAPAHAYCRIVLALRREGTPFNDLARNYRLLPELQLKKELRPYPHQQTALQAWSSHDCRGVVSLPTGSGKTILAVLAIARLQRPTLVLVPTIDLLAQWTQVLEELLNMPVSMLGGGSHEVGEITVSTYDSAVLNMEFIGNRFAFLIADECHHLPGPETRLAAAMCIAPFRLGLSATPEMETERSAALAELMGDTVCDIGITELAGCVLAPYRTCRIPITLTPEEQTEYNRCRGIYTNFLRAHNINFSRPGAWGEFIIACSRCPGGKAALQAFAAQRKIARNSRQKFTVLAEILHRHSGERIIIFTADNETAYQIGRTFVLPVLTHHTKAAERKAFLQNFRNGNYPVLVTSKVLNEGVDVPDAAVGVVLSGSGSVREHVQRLGRILRSAPGKEQAVLYELVSVNTSEESTSDRRREHNAYRRRS